MNVEEQILRPANEILLAMTSTSVGKAVTSNLAKLLNQFHTDLIREGFTDAAATEIIVAAAARPGGGSG